MATVIDALVVELGLDPSKFTKGQKEAIDSMRSMETEARKRGKAVEDSAKGVEQGFAAVQGRLLGLAGLLVGGLGIEQFIQRMTKLQVATANVAQVFGMSSQMMQQWAAAGERVGVSGSAVAQGMQALQQQRYNLQNFGDPSGILSLSWGTRGTSNPLNVQAPNGQMLPPDQMAMEIAKWLQKAGPQGANALMRMGGLSQDFVALLMQGPEKLKRLLEETKKNAPTDAEIAKWKELNDSFEAASQSATKLGRKMAEDMIPAFVRFFDVITKGANWLSEKFGNEPKKYDTPQDAARDLHRRMTGKDVTGLTESIRRKEAELKANTENLAGAKGLYRAPLEAEQRKLTEEIRKLREELQKQQNGGATFQNQSMIGGFGAGGDNARLINASLTGGGGIGGLTWGGGAQRGSGGGGRTRGDAYVPDESVGAGLTGSAYLAAQRAGIKAEMEKDPGLRDELAGMMRLEGTPIQSMESLANRYVATNEYRKSRGLPPLSVRQMLHGGFYGPINRGQLPGAVAGLKRSPAEMKRMQDAIDAVVNRGTNVVEGATDQGMPSDPNGRHVGSDGFRLRKGGNVFNDWGGGGGHSWNERWRRATQERMKREGTADVPIPRSRPRDLEKIERAGMDMRADARGGGSSAGDMNIGNVHIYPHKVDGDLASVIRPSVKRFARIASVNNGPA